MAKRATAQADQIITELIKNKTEFKKDLNERISLGEEIYNRNVQTHPEFDSLKTNFSAWSDYNSEYLKQCFNNPNNEYKREYEQAGYYIFGSLGGNNQNPVEEYKTIISAKLENLKKLVAKTDLLKSSFTNQKPLISTSHPEVAKHEVFIVHGHDDEAKIKTARFIEKLGFKPIILHEQASSGKTIIEKIEEYSNVGFGIVLYTPCDIGGKQTEPPNLNFRARQNVVFEHGYLIGKIGRPNVCALVKGNIETPNDISGVVYVTMDDANAWHLNIAKELRNSGYTVDMNKIV